MTTHFSRLHYIQKSCAVCVFAKKWPRCIRLHPNTNVTGERRSSHIKVSTLICLMSSFSLFSHSPILEVLFLVYQNVIFFHGQKGKVGRS